MEATTTPPEVGGNKKLIETFCAITSSSPEEAYFFLESHNFDLDSAVSTFFENATATATATTDSTPPNQNLNLNNSPQSPPYYPSPTPSPSPLPSEPRSTVSMASRGKKPSKPNKASGSRGGVRTLADLNRQSDDHGSDSDSDGPQEYYTGGEKSGMLVQGPPRGGNDVESIFNHARELGARDGPADHSSSSSRNFTGTGRLLSGVSVPSAAPEPPECITHNIVFYDNGFAVDDGPLRSLDDPDNAPFLESIKKSECPKELEPADRSTQVHVNLTRREGNRPEPEKQHVPFQGVGRTLGSSSVTPVVPEPTVVAAAPIQTAAYKAAILNAAALNAAPSTSAGLVVDSTMPSTSIQLRLADGTRMVARFNYHHTISDIRAFIDASRPGNPRTYHLQTVGFPPKQLTDVSQTIEQAGLGNSVVIQKL